MYGIKREELESRVLDKASKSEVRE
jgi:hypothetical protein